jgi:Lysyl oxidase
VPTRRLIATLAVLAPVAVAVAAGPAPAPARSDATLLPDLRQEAPSGLELTASGPASRRHWRLGFRSAVSNVGRGPLVIDGHRADTATPAMVADQRIAVRGAPALVVPAVGRLRYVHSTDHQHWHLQRFDRYELRRAGAGAVLARDRKSGFCLGDRYRTFAATVARRSPVYTSRCGWRLPGLLRLREGISPGFGDDYKAFLEDQDLPLNGLPAGRYVLVHRVNGDRRLREESYANNAASVLVRLRWTAGVPRVRLLRTCPGTDRCDGRGPTAATPAVARVARVASVARVCRLTATERRDA